MGGWTVECLYYDSREGLIKNVEDYLSDMKEESYFEELIVILEHEGGFLYLDSQVVNIMNIKNIDARYNILIDITNTKMISVEVYSSICGDAVLVDEFAVTERTKVQDDSDSIKSAVCKLLFGDFNN